MKNDILSYLDSINPIDLERKKFSHLRGLKVSPFDNLNNQNSISDRLLIVAHVWDDLRYAQYLYLSLLSQYLFTDIENFDVKIFFSHSLIEYKSELRRIFSPLVKSIHFKHNRFKYFTGFYEETTQYEFIFHVDSDLFFCGSKKSFYKSLLAFYEKKSEVDGEAPYICFYDYPYRSNEFRIYDWAKVRSESDVESRNEVKDWLLNEIPIELSEDKLDRWVQNERWPWNVFYGYDRRTFSSYGFKELVDWWYRETDEWWEEEKLYWIWLNYKEESFVTINEIFNDNIRAVKPYSYKEDIPPDKLDDFSYKELHKKDVENNLKDLKWEGSNTLYLVHPIVYNKHLLRFNQVTNNFLRFLIESANSELKGW